MQVSKPTSPTRNLGNVFLAFMYALIGTLLVSVYDDFFNSLMLGIYMYSIFDKKENQFVVKQTRSLCDIGIQQEYYCTVLNYSANLLCGSNPVCRKQTFQ